MARLRFTCLWSCYEHTKRFLTKAINGNRQGNVWNFTKADSSHWLASQWWHFELLYWLRRTHKWFHNLKEIQFVPMKQVLPPGGFVQMVHTQEKTDSHALAQTVTTQSLTGKRWEGAWSRTSLIYKSWITDPATERKNCLDSAKNLEDIVYGSWSMVLHTVTHFCESFGSLWRLVGLSQDLNSLSLVWIEYSTSVLNSFST